MGILGIGVDLVYVPRILVLLTRRNPEKFASKILSIEEHKQWSEIQDTNTKARVRFLAVRWSVKEAAYKAMYPTVKPLWRQLTYRSLTPHGDKPSLEYHPALPEDGKNVGKMHVSVSHDGDYVYSSVVVEERKTE
ncbi:hypothetical protein CVT24_009490 [Panaeolus cyanescens]|uniref:4'-phosphopantetheinyl transferase domain-containing protein n=1 Tax=Panaeolus cyanescens TaxID=181874 RepID=A0A409VAF6_9AGAR|nr:hypothetical protein CVT24_009490 [Panaeolus cyanescens]